MAPPSRTPVIYHGRTQLQEPQGADANPAGRLDQEQWILVVPEPTRLEGAQGGVLLGGDLWPSVEGTDGSVGSRQPLLSSDGASRGLRPTGSGEQGPADRATR